MEKIDGLTALSALAQETRLDAFRALVRAGPEGLAQGALADSLGVRPNTLSAALSALGRAGLVRSRREGRSIRYFTNMEGVRALLGFLLEDCCGGHPDICQPLLDEIACAC